MGATEAQIAYAHLIRENFPKIAADYFKMAMKNGNVVGKGKYAMCLRIKTSSTTSSNILQVRVSNGSTSILSKDIKGSDFSSANKYGYIYMTFDYEGDGVTKNNLKIEVYTHTVSGITICFDYAYIGMIIPAVFL